MRLRTGRFISHCETAASRLSVRKALAIQGYRLPGATFAPWDLAQCYEPLLALSCATNHQQAVLRLRPILRFCSSLRFAAPSTPHRLTALHLPFASCSSILNFMSMPWSSNRVLSPRQFPPVSGAHKRFQSTMYAASVYMQLASQQFRTQLAGTCTVTDSGVIVCSPNRLTVRRLMV